jgi:hypothetical protein
MRGQRQPVPMLTMTIAEVAYALGIDPALAHRLADDGQFPLAVIGSGTSCRVPTGQAAVLIRALRPAQRPAAAPNPKEDRWPGPS